MKFHELPINAKFRHNGTIYVKIPAEKANCCKTTANCQNWETKQKAKISPEDEVEEVQS